MAMFVGFQCRFWVTKTTVNSSPMSESATQNLRWALEDGQRQKSQLPGTEASMTPLTTDPAARRSSTI